jgi:hypothetical protein
VIILSGEADRFDIAGSKANKGFASFEFQIDLITHKSVQSIYLINVVHNATYALVDLPLPGGTLRDCRRAN